MNVPTVQQPTRQDLEVAITAQSALAARYGRYWRDYEDTHREINRLLDEWQKITHPWGLTRLFRIR